MSWQQTGQNKVHDFHWVKSCLSLLFGTNQSFYVDVLFSHTSWTKRIRKYFDASINTSCCDFNLWSHLRKISGIGRVVVLEIGQQESPAERLWLLPAAPGPPRAALQAASVDSSKPVCGFCSLWAVLSPSDQLRSVQRTGEQWVSLF